jgi:hypothetical protein
MAEPLSILKGTKAELVFTHDSSQASDVLFAQWQVSISALVGANEPKSSFDKLATDTTLFPSTNSVVVCRIPVLVNADFSVLEILGTFGYKSQNSDGPVTATFLIRDNDTVLLSTTDLSADEFRSVAGSSVFRGVFSPGQHVFTLKVLVADGPILIVGGALGSTALYIQQMKA